jgi:hypothetical protein
MITDIPEVIEAMRAWIADCSWVELEPDDISELAPSAITRGVARHYAGGIAQFLEDGGLTGESR